jgi:hypothetical protein
MAGQAVGSGRGEARRGIVVLVCAACVFGAAQAYAQVSVLTYSQRQRAHRSESQRDDPDPGDGQPTAVR